MTELQKAYAAGLFDGEGSVGVYSHKEGHCTLKASLGSINHNVVEMLRDWFGVGHFWSWTDKKSRLHAMKVIGTTGRNACKILRDILPYLHTKKRQAESALAFHSCPWRGRTGPPGRNEWQKRIDLWFCRESKRLKHVGLGGETT